MSETIDARKVLKQAKDAIDALQHYVEYLEQQLARQQNGSSGKIQEEFMSWFKPTDEQIKKREEQRLQYQRQEDNANAYEAAEAAKKEARDELEYKSRNHATLYR